METGKREYPEPGFWERVAASLTFTPKERERMLEALALFEAHVARLSGSRANLHARLQALASPQPLSLLGVASSGEENEVLALLERETLNEFWAVSAVP